VGARRVDNNKNPKGVHHHQEGRSRRKKGGEREGSPMDERRRQLPKDAHTGEVQKKCSQESD